MASEYVAKDFVTYLTTNWASVTGHTVPDVIKAVNFDRSRRIQGYQGTNTNGVVLVHRGSIHYVPMDYKFRSIMWGTSIMLSGPSGTKVETLFKDLMHIVDDWESAGGGAFVSGGLLFTTLETGTFEHNFEGGGVIEISFFSKQEARG